MSSRSEISGADTEVCVRVEIRVPGNADFLSGAICGALVVGVDLTARQCNFARLGAEAAVECGKRGPLPDAAAPGHIGFLE